MEFFEKVSLLQKVALSPALIKGVAQRALKGGKKTVQEVVEQLGRISGAAKSGKGSTAKSMNSLGGVDDFVEGAGKKFKSHGDAAMQFDTVNGKIVDRAKAGSEALKDFDATVSMPWSNRSKAVVKGVGTLGGLYAGHTGFNAASSSFANPGNKKVNLFDPQYNYRHLGANNPGSL